MRLSLDSLQVLDAIDRHGTFAAAAAALHRVPSAVSYAIQKLEQDLDIVIFDRDGHRARLTAAGAELLKDGRLLLEAADALECRVKRVATGWESELRIAVADLFDWRVLLPVLQELAHQAPDTRIQLRREVLGGVWDALLTGRADVVIGAPEAGPAGGGYVLQAMGQVPFVFAVAPGHALADMAEPIAATELRRHTVVAAADSSRQLPPRSVGLQNGQAVLTMPDMQGKLQAQLLGLGVGFLPWHWVAGHVQRGELMVKQVEEPRPAALAHYAWRNESGGRARQLLLDWLAGCDFEQHWLQPRGLAP